MPFIKKEKEYLTCVLDFYHLYIHTTKFDKKQINKQIARALHVTNNSFTCIEKPDFKEAITLLHSEYVPSSQHDEVNV